MTEITVVGGGSRDWWRPTRAPRRARGDAAGSAPDAGRARPDDRAALPRPRGTARLLLPTGRTGPGCASAGCRSRGRGCPGGRSGPIRFRRDGAAARGATRRPAPDARRPAPDRAGRPGLLRAGRSSGTARRRPARRRTLIGVVTFDADPGRLSAAFVWERLLRVTAPQFPAGALRHRRVDDGGRAARRPRPRAGSGHRDGLTGRSRSPTPRSSWPPSWRPRGGCSVTTPLWPGRAAARRCSTSALRARRRTCSWSSTSTRPGSSSGTALRTRRSPRQAIPWCRPSCPLRAGESKADGLVRLERAGRARAARLARPHHLAARRASAPARTGALDLPGRTWRDRPAIDRGDGVFLAGDMVAAPGLLGEVAFASAVEAARGAVRAAGIVGPPGHRTESPHRAPHRVTAPGFD